MLVVMPVINGCSTTGMCTIFCKQPTSQGYVNHKYGPYHDMTNEACIDERKKVQEEVKSWKSVCRHEWEPY